MNHIRFAAISFALLGSLVAVAQTPPQRFSLAIVPFTNTKPDAATDWIGHAAAETLALKLETLPAISCVERAMVQKKVGKKLEIGDKRAVASLGKALSADRVVVASYEVSGEDLKIDLRVIDSRAAECVASASRSVRLKDVVDTVSALAGDVVASFDKQAKLVDLKPEVYDAPAAERLAASDAERKKMLVFARPTYEAFEQFGKGLSDPDPFKQIKYFTEALKKDSTFFIPRLYRGFTHLDEKHAEMALDDFDGAIKADKTWPEPHYRKGQIYESLGRTRLASIAYNNYIERSKGQRSKRLDDVRAKLKKWQETGQDKKDDAGPPKKP
jgi:TolB-like protein